VDKGGEMSNAMIGGHPMRGSKELKELEEKLQKLNSELIALELQIETEQWRIVQEETGVREGVIIATPTARYRVTGVYDYCPPRDHALMGQLQNTDGSFQRQSRGIFEEWKIKEDT